MFGGKNFRGIGMTSQRTRDRLIRRLQDQGIENAQVLEVMATTPRHLFVDEALSHRAYEDTALPIGYGQTISQPYIVAKMSQCLLSGVEARSVLEIGTGCGYQTAVLAGLFPQVYSVERIEALYHQSRQRLAGLDCFNIQLRHTDGHGGWPNPGYQFDRILMTAACRAVPEALVQQLVVNGMMVFPLDNGQDQTLIKLTRTAAGLSETELEKVSFVPLLSGLVHRCV